jgi:hypothetical protein
MSPTVDPNPPQARAVLRWLVVATLVVICSAYAGYGWRRGWGTALVHYPWTVQPVTQSPDTVSTAKSPAPTSAAGESALSAEPLYEQQQSPQTHKSVASPESGLDLQVGYQTLTPPDEPPPVIAPPPPEIPSTEMLSELLYGQELVAKNFWGNFGWLIEPGEILELTVDAGWDDPENLSNGVYITFVVMADGKGMRASGLLRYYGDGTEGSGYAVRDFTSTKVERVGSW